MNLEELLPYIGVGAATGAVGTAVGVVGTAFTYTAYKLYKAFKGNTYRNGVAVIPIDGAISNSGGASPIPFMSKGASYPMPLKIRNMINTATKDYNIKGIVFEINSPGGEVQPSEEIANYIRDCVKRETKESVRKRKKNPSLKPEYETLPKVGLIKNLGASGGYLIAGECDYLFGSEMSNIGSIGVIMARPDASEFLKRHGIEMKFVKSHERKGMGHPALKWSKEEEKYSRKHCTEIAEWFVNRVVAARKNLDKETVVKLATGEAYTGLESLENGLIDEITSHREVAIKKLEELGNFHHDHVKDFRLDFSKFPKLPFPMPGARMDDLAYQIGQGIADGATRNLEQLIYAPPKARI